MRSPEEVFQDYQARKTGILTALTTEVDAFFQACDPNSDNLCLYGNSDSSWVRLEPHCLWFGCSRRAMFRDPLTVLPPTAGGCVAG